MTGKPTYKELEDRVRQLEKESARQNRFENINSALFKISNALNITDSLDELYESIHRILSSVIDTKNFYISLYDKSKDSITFPYCIDSVDESYPPQIEISKIESLTAKVLQTGQPLLITRDEVLKQRAESKKKLPGCTPSKVWLGVPLKTQESIIGVMTVQSYSDSERYDQTDMEVMVSVADQIAVAIELKSAQQAFQKSEKRFHYLADATIEAIFFTKDGICLEANQAAADMFGYDDPSEFIGIFGTEIIAPESHEIVREHMLKNLFDSYEAVGKRRDGTCFPIAIQAKPMPYKDKRSVRVTSIMDISGRKQAEEVNKTLFAISNAVNITPDMNDLFGYIHDALSRIIDVTNFFIAMVDIKTRTLHFPYYVDTGGDEDFPPITDFNEDDSLTGLLVFRRRPVLLKKRELEKRAEQNGIWGPVPLIWMGVPLIIKNEVIGVVAVQSYSDPNLYNEQDLQLLSGVSDQMAIAIDRKRSEDALRESEQKYRHLFKNAPSGIFEIDFEKVRFVNVNELMCKYSGYSEKEFLSMNPQDLLTENSKNLYFGRLEKLFKGEILPGSVEYNIVTKNGRELCVILNNDFIYKDGKVTGARVVAHDITELKKAQEDKIKAQKIAGEHEKLALIGQVAGKIAHDFNNILGIIMGNAELALFDCEEKETAKTLELIFEQTLRGKNLTRNLSAFARDQEPRQEFFMLSEKINLVLDLLKKDLEKIEVIKEEKSGVPDLLADPGMIEHAVLNLLQNSIHATSISKNPQIIIRIYCLDENICFEIEDNGCGIPKEYLAKIYVPSFTLKGSRDLTDSYEKGIKGSGYGLSNVKKYVEQHKGTISFESELGSGTKVTLRLPVIKKELTSEEKIQIQKETIHFKKHILLVEDEPTLSDVFYRILTQEPCNHKVDIASNGQAAMDFFNENEYDCISLDYILPEKINGLDVYDHIRKTNKTIPILFVSGNIEFLESMKELKQNDANIDHLSKPCRNEDYINGINDLLGRTVATKK
ncbi:MAG: PAS domain S-box protein [Desulfobacterales bacterium]|nr:PAS domain S-box protein [Desulfobacterales bacterium]